MNERVRPSLDGEIELLRDESELEAYYRTHPDAIWEVSPGVWRALAQVFEDPGVGFA